ncbi:MAG: diaminopimelate epimerase [Ignavibacteria bacterium]|nr:diaminopimelate epimerase [Ignavibacteria bacterium]
MKTWHMSGAGNRFVVIDGRLLGNPATQQSTIQPLVPKICDRSAIGLEKAEGVLVLISSGEDTFSCLYFNPDGSSGMMCGNGSRCIFKYASEFALPPGAGGHIAFLMNSKLYVGWLNVNGTVTIVFEPPLSERIFESGSFPNVPSNVYYVDVNSDHAVVTDIHELTIEQILAVRRAPVFPNGCNVNIVKAVSGDSISIATFERGVEGFTQACGTGAISVAIALWRLGKASDEVEIIPPSLSPLVVKIGHEAEKIVEVSLTGDAVYDAEPTEFDVVAAKYLR